MNYKKLYSLDTDISELSLGTFPFKGWWGEPLTDQIVTDIILRAIELGVNYIDTADVYGLGVMEGLLGKILKKVDEKILIATKGGRDFTTVPGKISKNFEIEYLNRAFTASLERLQRKSVDVYFLHGPEEKDIKKAEIFSFVDGLKEKGLAKAVGLSINNFEEMELILEYYKPDIISVKYNYLSDFSINLILDMCEKNNIDIILREPLERGLLAGKYSEKSIFPENDHRKGLWNSAFWNSKKKKLNKFQKLYDTNSNNFTKSQLAIDYCRQINGVKSVLFGVKSMKQLEENLAICKDR